MMTEITISPYSIFGGYDHLQHSGAAYNTPYNILYHTYVAPNAMKIADALIYAYEYSFAVDKETDGRKKNGRIPTPRGSQKDRSAEEHSSVRSGTSTLKSVVQQSQNPEDKDEEIEFDEEVEHCSNLKKSIIRKVFDDELLMFVLPGRRWISHHQRLS